MKQAIDKFRDIFFRKDGKSFAAISIRRRKKTRQMPAQFFERILGPKAIQIQILSLFTDSLGISVFIADCNSIYQIQQLFDSLTTS